MCINVSPSPSDMRPEPIVKPFQMNKMNTFTLMLLFFCSIVFILSRIDLNIRYIPFDTRLNTLTASKKASSNEYVHIFLLLLLYVAIFEYFFIVLLPYEFFMSHLIRGVTKKSVILVKIAHNSLGSITLGACSRFTYLSLYSRACFCHYPVETLTVWISLMHIALCPDIHPNPGPDHTNIFAGGFLSFCNWNLNTLSKDDFYRITLLQAHNTDLNYDIISLCETSLDDEVQVPEMPGYKFHSCNHPDGIRSGGVGMFYKESLPLKIREDLSFNESIVCELIFGHKHIFLQSCIEIQSTKQILLNSNLFLKI